MAAKRDRELFEALNKVPKGHSREAIIKHLSPQALSRLRNHTKKLLEGHKKHYKLDESQTAVLSASLKKHKARLQGFVFGEQISPTAAMAVRMVLSALIPLLTCIVIEESYAREVKKEQKTKEVAASVLAPEKTSQESDISTESESGEDEHKSD